MKKKYAYIIGALAVIILIIVVVVVTRLNPKTTESADTRTPTAAQTESESKEPLPEPGTVYIDKEHDVSASFGVEETDGEIEEEDESKPDGSEHESASGPESPTEQEPAPMPAVPAKSSYEEFYALSPEQKDEFLHSFESYDAFYEWLVAAQEEFKNTHPDIEIEPGGSIDLSKYMS